VALAHGLPLPSAVDLEGWPGAQILAQVNQCFLIARLRSAEKAYKESVNALVSRVRIRERILMSFSMSAWIAEPLTWGRGPRILEAFLEPTCPYSARAFPKLFELVEKIGADRISVKIRLQSQPWHMFSGVVVRAILAASTTRYGKEAAKSVMGAVFDRREEFEFEMHCMGPNMDTTPNQILSRIEKASGVTLVEQFQITDLDREVKWHTKYARQNGIHSTPTFMVDGLINPNLNSGDDVETWVKVLN